MDSKSQLNTYLTREACYLWRYLFTVTVSPDIILMYIHSHTILQDFQALPEGQVATIQALLKANVNPVAVEPYLRSNTARRHALTGKLLLLCYLNETMSAQPIRNRPDGRLLTLLLCIMFFFRFIHVRFIGYIYYKLYCND